MNIQALPPAFAAIPLRGGLVATLRPIAPGDAAAERDFVAGLSVRSRCNRFHGAVNGVTEAMARYLTCVDQQRHVALVATVVEDGREIVIADARYVATDDTAEFAIAVADRWQGCGIARRLLEALAACADRSGVRWLVGDVLATNQQMLGLAERLGFVRASREPQGGVVRIERAVVPVPVEADGIFVRVLGRLVQYLAPARAAAPRDMFAQF